MPNCGTHLPRRAHWRRRSVMFAASAALILSACTPPAGDIGAITSMPETHPAEPGAALDNTSLPTETASEGELLPVYWLGDNNGKVRLYREFLPAVGDGDPIAAAVREMTTSTPLDPDYFGAWAPAETVSTSISPDNVITVDISSSAFENPDAANAPISADTAYLAVQQLVFTATAAAANSGLIASGEPSSVVLLVDGKSGFVAFGHVKLGGEIPRDPSLPAPIWIISPQAGESRNQATVVVQGSGISPDSTLDWRIEQRSAGTGRSIGPKEGTAELDSSPGMSGLFEFSVALPPGEYEITVYNPTGAGTSSTDSDTKNITIR